MSNTAGNIRDTVGETIFLVAGMPASGILELIRSGNGLFGKYTEQFLAFSSTSGKPFHYFKNLKAKSDKDPNFSWPKHVLLHVEITAACSFKLRPYKSFYDDTFVVEELRRNMSPILSRYATVVVNTIKPDLATLANRFLTDLGSIERDDNVYLLYKNRDQRSLDSVFAAWNKYLEEADCYSLQTTWDEQERKFHISEVSQPKPRRLDTMTTWQTLPTLSAAQWRVGPKTS